MSDFFSYGGSAPRPETAPPPPAAPARAILGELSSEDWEKFIGYTARRRYPAGARIVQGGEPSPGLCFIATGQVEVVADPAVGDRARTLRGEGEVFGLLSFLDGAASGASAQVTTAGPAELLLLSPEALQQLAAWQPRIAVALLRDLGAHVATRLRNLQAGD